MLAPKRPYRPYVTGPVGIDSSLSDSQLPYFRVGRHGGWRGAPGVGKSPRVGSEYFFKMNYNVSERFRRWKRDACQYLRSPAPGPTRRRGRGAPVLLSPGLSLGSASYAPAKSLSFSNDPHPHQFSNILQTSTYPNPHGIPISAQALRGCSHDKIARLNECPVFLCKNLKFINIKHNIIHENSV